MAVFQTKALILRHTPDREYDRIITVLTPELGQQRLRARGTKKSVSKLAGSLEPLTEVELSFAEGRTLGTVTGSVIHDRFKAVRQDMFSLLAAQWLLELTERMTKPNQPEGGAYDLVSRALRDLPQHTNWSIGKRLMLLDRWAWRMLDGEGFAPVVDQCGICGQPILGERGFDTHGFRHLDHQPAVTLTVSEQVLHWMSHDEPPLEDKQDFLTIHHLLQTLLLTVLDHPLRSEKVLHSVTKVLV